MKKSIEIVISDNPKTHQEKIGSRLCHQLTHFVIPITVTNMITKMSFGFVFVTIIEFDDK